MRIGWFIAGLLTLVVAGIGVGGAISYGSDDTLSVGFRVGGLTVGGQSPESAIQQIQTRVSELQSTRVTVNGDDLDAGITPPSLTFQQLGMQVDVGEGLRAIEEYRDYTWWDRAKVRYRKNDLITEYGIKITWDENVLRKATSEVWGSLIKGQPVAATRTINDRDEVVYTPEQLGKQLDLNALLVDVRSNEPAALTVVLREPVKLKLPVIKTAPVVTVSKLKEEGIERKIAEFTTSFTTSGEGRSHNVTVAAKALNETLLMPDEVFEYGKIVAKADKEYGYKEAPVILKGKLTPGIGGGICQVSSTLYNAALLSGLDIVERRNHSLVVHYMPKGLDATFADGYVNFKFRNSTGKQLLIRTVVQDKQLTVKLFGTMPENVTYSTETVELKVNLPKIVYVANSKLTLGKQDTLQKGEAGYVVEAYRVKKIDGAFVERRKLSKDTYRAQDTLIAVNPKDPRLSPGEGGSGGNGAATPDPSESPTPSGDNGDEGPIEPV
jgi:vancomycin resistance protein YoaR